MFRMLPAVLIAAAAVLGAPFAAAVASDAEDIARYRHQKAIEGLAQSTGDEAIRQFIDLHLAPGYRDAFAPGALTGHVRKIREACAGFDGVLLRRMPDGAVRIQFLKGGEETVVIFRQEAVVPYRIVALDVEATGPSGTAPAVVPPFSWDTLEERLDAEARNGFSGTVLVVRGGETALHRAYGFADREKRVPNTTATIFAIGSTPIDFTKASVLKLEEMGKLTTSDPITKYLEGVPPDKQAMTIDHLLTSRSGLPDFHDITGVDANPDLTWIDREEAVRRILSADLLFPPGRGEAHSHSAWVLLAALVEIVSKQAYGDFLREQFFKPAGMTRTGLHEDLAGVPDDEIAVGYEGRPVGKVNSPKYWGRTSWLVMGSGGMSSTPEDLYRWMRAIREGRTLSAAAAKKYWSPGGILAGGDDRGFLNMYTEGPGDLMIMCSNAHSRPGDQASAIGERLARLVFESALPPFTLGIQMRVETDGRVVVSGVARGSAAARDGLEEGDVLISANGVPMKDPVREVLVPFLKSGEAVVFEIERGGKKQAITVKPKSRPREMD